MALLTPISIDEARALGSSFGLAVADARPILAGSVNTNVALALEGGGRAFLRVYEEQTPTTARHEAALLTHLGREGVPTPTPLRRADGAGFVAEHRGKPVSVFPWIEGEVLCQKRVTAEATFEVGAALARVHLAGLSFRDPPPSRFGVADLEARLAWLHGRDLPEDLRADVDRLAARLARHAERKENSSWSLVHGDLFRDNVLWHEGRLAALLDFESAARESRPFDLMVTALAFCFGDRLEFELVKAMFAGYASVRPLPTEERGLLYEEASFAVTRFAITRVTDFELRPRGSGVFKDYRRFLARAEALDALGRDGLEALAR